MTKYQLRKLCLDGFTYRLHSPKRGWTENRPLYPDKSSSIRLHFKIDSNCIAIITHTMNT